MDSKLNILDSASEIFFWIPGPGLNHIKSFRPRKDQSQPFLYPKVRAPVCHKCTWQLWQHWGKTDPPRFRCLHQHRAWDIPRRKTTALFSRDLQWQGRDTGHPGDERENAHFSSDKMRARWHQSPESSGDCPSSLPLRRRSEQRIYWSLQMWAVY